MVPTIGLTRGLRARVDWQDYRELSQYKWHATTDLYAARTVEKNREQEKIYMHRQVLELGRGDSHVDHKNHDTLDNRRRNIRLCTRRENAENLLNQSRWGVGVRLDRRKLTKPFEAYAHGPEGKRVYLGMFEAAEEAQRARRRFVDRIEEAYLGPVDKLHIEPGQLKSLDEE